MGKAPNQHATPHGDQWGVCREGDKRLTSIQPVQAEAIDTARETARRQHSELVIHRPDGTIRDRDRYGPGRCPPRGRKILSFRALPETGPTVSSSNGTQIPTSEARVIRARTTLVASGER
jgi:hypothetical protein